MPPRCQTVYTTTTLVQFQVDTTTLYMTSASKMTRRLAPQPRLALLAISSSGGKPGCEMSVVRVGVAPSVHVQSGSPSSCPLDWPSPSESARQSCAVHFRPAPAKAAPKGLRAPPPCLETCPTPRPPSFTRESISPER